MILQGGNWKGLTYTCLSTEDDLGVIAEIYDISKDFNGLTLKIDIQNYNVNKVNG